jgi:PAS domain S-box-containing protein
VAGTAAAEILGYPANAVRLYDPETALLDPVVVADRTKALMGAREPYPPGSGISGQAFADGEPMYVPDGSDLGNGPAFADVGAIYAHPLGDVGVLTVGTTEAGAINESDRTLVAILAAIAETALERAADERELRQLQRIIDQVGGQLLLLDGTDQIDFATSGFADTLEADSAALEGRPLTAVLAATADTAAVEAAIETVRTGTEATMTVETRLATAGGERPVELEFSAVGETGAGAAVAAAVTDIRELATTRAALSSQRDRFRELVEVLPVPVTEVRFEDGTAVTEFVNSAFTEVFGYDTATLQGERVNEYIAPMAADAAAIDERLAAGDEVALEVQRETVNGSRDFLLRASTYDQEGDRRAFGIYTDITAQRERERYLTILNRVLRHNFRNDLTVIMGFAETLEANVADPTLADHAGRIVAAGQSLSALSERARELEALVGTRDTDRTPVAVHPQLEAALDACEAAARATVVRDFADLPAVLAGDRLQQAFTELIANAIEHADAGTPQLTVTTGRTGDGQVAVRFTDDGPGIPDTEWQVISGDTEVTQLQHATGLGLWLVRWIVDSYNGTLSRSRNPTGTTVTITLEPTDSSPHD